MSKTIFISKSRSELEKLQQYALENEIEIVSHSFLHFSELIFSIPYPYEVIFFGSPRAVMFFKAQNDISKDKLVACVGGKTETLLKSLGVKVAFSGANKGSIGDVAEAFKTWLGDKQALFPISTKSLGTISKNIPSQQKQLVEVYDTQVQPKTIKPCDIYVFTSPSNVEGFLMENEIPIASKVIAWGDSTDAKLKAEGLQPDIVLEEPGLDCLEKTFKTI